MSADCYEFTLNSTTGRLTAADVLEGFDKLWRRERPSEALTKVEVVVPSRGANLHPDALCALARCLLRAQSEGLSVQFSGDLRNGNRLANYLSRTNLFGILGLQPSGLPLPELDRIGLHLPIRRIHDHDDVFEAVNRLVEMLLHQAECSPGILDGFEWSINEVIDNILVHAESPLGGIVIGQTVKHPPCVRVAIGDFGRGIKASLSERFDDLRMERDAILHATTPGVTRDPDIGQGNGLAGTRQIVEENEGTLVVTSNDWTVQMGSGAPKSWVEWSFPGTQVVITLRTDRSLDLTKTLVGEVTVPYIENSYENDAGERVIVVKDHISSCGNRPAGRIMRNLLKNVSGPDGQAVALDFSGVRSVSSSFADEFIGKYAKQIGRDVFLSRHRIIVERDLHRAVLNKALHTRGGEKAE